MATRRIVTDVLVVGGGTAGFGAAVAAGRTGLDVTLIEATDRIGGVMAFCPGMPWGGAFPAGRIIGGLLAELYERLLARDPPAAERRPCALENFGDEIVYDPEAATLEMLDMLEGASVRLCLRTVASELTLERERIAGVTCHDRLGPLVIAPRIVIDASGDGDISASAGVPFHLGDDRGAMMAVTVSFHMIGVDCDAAFAGGDPYFRDHARKGVAEGRLHPDLADLYLMRGFHPGTVFCNSVHVRGIDGTNPLEVARATREGRRRCQELADFLRAEVPGFAGAYMAMVSPMAGVRETRKLEGIYRLTGADIASGRKFADGIVACDNPIDDVMRADRGMTHGAALKARDHYTIPFRALVPKRVGNLMFAGRIISADPVAFASVRGMPQCMAMGQATGTAAALALEEDCPVQDVPAERLVAALREADVNRIGPIGAGTAP